MKKTLTTGITFDASAKTVEHADFSAITIKGIFLITNITDQTIIYNFADTTKGGTLAGDILTLEYDTTSMSDTDDLQIIVDDGSTTQEVSAASLPLPTGAATSAKQDTIIGHVDGIEGLLTTIDTDTGNMDTKLDAIKTAVETLDNAISGSEIQADIVASLPAGSNTIGNVIPTDGSNAQVFSADNTDSVAASATANKPNVMGRNTLWGSSAANWTRQRQVENATDSTGTGISAAGILGQFDDTSPGTVTENRFGNIRMSVRREMYNQIRDAAGNERGANVDANGNLNVILPNNGAGAVASNTPRFTLASDDPAVAALQAGLYTNINRHVCDSASTGLTANTERVYSLTVSGFTARELEITNVTGSSAVYYTLNNTLPSSTNFTGVLPATPSSVVIPVSGTPTLRVISAGTPIVAAVVRGA